MELYDFEEIKLKFNKFLELDQKRNFDTREECNLLRSWLVQTIPYLIGRIEGKETGQGKAQTP